MSIPANTGTSAADGWRPYLLLTFLAIVFFVPGIASIPPTDRDEARFVQATRQMMESGDYVRIRFLDTPRNKKPAGAYWLQAAAVRAFATPETRSMWPYRIPSLLAVWSALLITFALARRLVGGPTALLGTVIVATTATAVAEAHLAKSDAPLFFAVCVTQGLLGALYVGARPGTPPASAWWPLMMWACLGFGVLIKGPVLPGVFLTTVLALSIADRRVTWLRRLRPFAGGLVCLAVALPWFIAVQHATDGAFLDQAVGEDILPKLLGAHESHGAPPGFYMLTSFASFWPWSLWTIPAVMHGWRHRERPTTRFWLAWLLPSLVVLELAPTKLPHYSLPLFPALAMLVAEMMRDGSAAAIAARPKLARFGFGAWGVVGVVLVAIVVGGPLYFDGHLDPVSLVVAVLGFGMIAIARRAGLAGMGDRWRWLPLVGALGFPLFLGVVFPGLDRFWLNPRLATAIAAVRETTAADRPLVVVDYNEPSLVFLEGGDLRLVGPREAAQLWTESCRTLAVVRERAHEAFLQALAEGGAPKPQVRAEVDGFNYSNGKWLRFFLYGRERCDG